MAVEQIASESPALAELKADIAGLLAIHQRDEFAARMRGKGFHVVPDDEGPIKVAVCGKGNMRVVYSMIPYEQAPRVFFLELPGPSKLEEGINYGS